MSTAQVIRHKNGTITIRGLVADTAGRLVVVPLVGAIRTNQIIELIDEQAGTKELLVPSWAHVSRLEVEDPVQFHYSAGIEWPEVEPIDDGPHNAANMIPLNRLSDER
jgi:hypothetical protein